MIPSTKEPTLGITGCIPTSRSPSYSIASGFDASNPLKNLEESARRQTEREGKRVRAKKKVRMESGGFCGWAFWPRLSGNPQCRRARTAESIITELNHHQSRANPDRVSAETFKLSSLLLLRPHGFIAISISFHVVTVLSSFLTFYIAPKPCFFFNFIFLERNIHKKNFNWYNVMKDFKVHEGGL